MKPESTSLLNPSTAWRRPRLALMLLVFIASAGIAPLSIGQAITEYPVPTPGAFPTNIAAGADGNLWFTELNASKIGRITTQGVITEFTLSTQPNDITAGPDGNLWFTEGTASKIARITPAGVITEFPLAVNHGPNSITSGPDGNLWFAESTNKIGRMTTTGDVTEFPISISNCFPQGITSGPDGNVWFLETNSNVGPNTNYVVKVDPSGTMTPFAIPMTANQFPAKITSGHDGNLWFTEPGTNHVGKATVSGTFAEFAVGFAPVGIAAGPDGNVWYAVSGGVGKIGRITPAGSATEFPVPTANSIPYGITAGADGNLWFTESGANQVGSIASGVGVPALTPWVLPLLALCLGWLARFASREDGQTSRHRCTGEAS
jgi:streptogramin lyase